MFILLFFILSHSLQAIDELISVKQSSSQPVLYRVLDQTVKIYREVFNEDENENISTDVEDYYTISDFGGRIVDSISYDVNGDNNEELIVLSTFERGSRLTVLTAEGEKKWTKTITAFSPQKIIKGYLGGESFWDFLLIEPLDKESSVRGVLSQDALSFFEDESALASFSATLESSYSDDFILCPSILFTTKKMPDFLLSISNQDNLGRIEYSIINLYDFTFTKVGYLDTDPIQKIFPLRPARADLENFNVAIKTEGHLTAFKLTARNIPEDSKEIQIVGSQILSTDYELYIPDLFEGGFAILSERADDGSYSNYSYYNIVLNKSEPEIRFKKTASKEGHFINLASAPSYSYDKEDKIIERNGYLNRWFLLDKFDKVSIERYYNLINGV